MLQNEKSSFKVRVSFNSPVILGFTAICLITHIIGGIVGAVLGYLMNKNRLLSKHSG